MDPKFAVGHYTCNGELLGRGSFASVYKGVNQISKETVAIKVIDVERLARTNNPKLQQHLDQEITVMKAMKHENIVELFDVYKSVKGDELYMVLEFCAGGDLSKYLAKQPERRLSEEHARYFMRQLASGLRFLRSKQVIHRDLKPQNLLLAVNASSKSIVLKIADFGFARFMEPQSLAETLCGSPLYMVRQIKADYFIFPLKEHPPLLAPELLKFQKYSVKADLWSVGAIMFEMLTGSVPFKCKNQMELMRMMETTPIVFPEHLKGAVSSPCIDLLFALLRKDLNQRISWDEFFLHPWLGFSAVPAPAPTSAPTSALSSALGSSPIPIAGAPAIPPELPARKRSQSFTPTSVPRSSDPYAFANRSVMPIQPSSSYKGGVDNSPALLSKSPPGSSNAPFFGAIRASSPSSALDIVAKYSSFMEEARVRTGSTPGSPTPASLPTNTPAITSPVAALVDKGENASDSFEKDCVIIHSGANIAENSDEGGASNTDETLIVNELEGIINRAVTVGEVAELKGAQDPAIGFVLLIKAVSILHIAHNIAKNTTLQNFALTIRVEGVVEKLQSRYEEFIRKAESLRCNLPSTLDVVPSAERVLYEYALQLGREAALDEEMFHNYSKSEIMLKMAVVLYEQLLSDCIEDSDKKVLASHILAYQDRMKDVKKKAERGGRGLIVQ